MPATIQTIHKPTRARGLDTSGNNSDKSFILILASAINALKSFIYTKPVNNIIVT